MPYKAGTFDFPTSAGAFAVTGLGFRPLGVILFGGNRSEVDSLVTSTGRPGVFISVNGVDWQDHVTVRSLCLYFTGRSIGDGVGFGAIQSPTGCIRMAPDNAASSTGIEMRAGPMSFNADGFSFSVTTPAPGVRPVHWMAWGGTSPLGVPFQLSTMRQNVGGLSPTFASPFQGLTTWVLNTHINNGAGFTEGALNGQAWFTLGSGHYPEIADDTGDWNTAICYTKIIQGTSIGTQGFTDDFVNFDLSTSHVISSVGPAFIEGLRRHQPQAVGATTFQNVGGGQANMYEHAMWWNGEGAANFASLPAPGASTTTMPPARFNPDGPGRKWDVVLFTTINGSSNSAGSTQLRYGFGILHPDYQGCVVVGADGTFYQSRSHCLASTSTAAGARHVVGEILPSGAYQLTNDSAGTLSGAVHHGWGGPLPASPWIPNIYRRVRSY